MINTQQDDDSQERLHLSVKKRLAAIVSVAQVSAAQNIERHHRPVIAIHILVKATENREWSDLFRRSNSV